MCDVKYQPTEEELKQVCNIPKALSCKYKYHDPEEIESLANVGLAKGIPKYDPDRGMKFCDWVYYYCLREIRMYFKSAYYRHNSTVGNIENHAIFEDKKNTPQLVNDIYSGKELLSKVHGRDREILVLHLNGESYHKIAKLIGINKDSVAEICRGILYKLKEGTKKKVGRPIQEWVKTNPKTASKVATLARQKGVRSNKRRNLRDRKNLGWEHLPLYQCKMLYKLLDGKSRTLDELKDNKKTNRKYYITVLRELSKLGYVQCKKYQRKKLLYQITEKAIKERTKSNG